MEKYTLALIWLLAIGLMAISTTAQIIDLGLAFVTALKVTQINCYTQIKVYGQGENSYEIANAGITSTSSTRFGYLAMIDENVTAGAAPTSNIIAQAEGLFGSADLTTPGFFRSYNLYFTSEPYTGSTLHIVGRDTPALTTRELAVTGGTGYFRMATGFVTVSTISGNSTSASDTFQLNITVYQPVLL